MFWILFRIPIAQGEKAQFGNLSQVCIAFKLDVRCFDTNIFVTRFRASC